MNFTVIFCCYVLLPYFASLVAPPQEAITCTASLMQWVKVLAEKLCFQMPNSSNDSVPVSVPASVHASVPVIPVKPVEPQLKDQWFTQNLDHYHRTEKKTWDQRYLVNDKYYNNQGTVYILIGKKEEITSEKMRTGQWIHYAQEAHALCVGIEYRSYDTKGPSGDLNTEDLKYMNSEQALADVAWFVYNFPSLRGVTIKLKWVAFGKSRGGTLATWLKMKFPHLIHATLSLSAPLMAKADFNEFYEGVETEMFNEENTEEKLFKEKIREAYKQISSYVEQNDYLYIGKTFGLITEAGAPVCNNSMVALKRADLSFAVGEQILAGHCRSYACLLATVYGDTITSFCDEDALLDKRNIDLMYFTFAHVVAKVMQLGKDNLKDIKKLVFKMMLSSEPLLKGLDPIQRFALVVKTVLGKYEPGCLMINYALAVRHYQPNTDADGENKTLYFPMSQIFGNRSDLYQGCTEFGYFQTFGAEDSFFGREITLQFYTDFCVAVFREQFDKQFLEKGIHRTNLFYGGLDIIVSHVVFVYAQLDPLRKLGLTDPKTIDSVTFILEGAFHCDELDDVDYVPNINDIKGNIIKKIMEWLKLH